MVISDYGEVATSVELCDQKKQMARLTVRLVFNNLKPSGRAKVEAHLSKCPYCMERYEALAAIYGNPTQR